MKRSYRYRVLFIVIGLAVIVASIFSLRSFMAQARLDQRITLTNQVVPLVSQSHLIGAANTQQQIDLSVSLKLRNQQTLDKLLNDIYDPHSSLYHHFLTPQQFAQTFGPTAEQQQQVVDYLHSQGMKVTSVSPNGVLIDASATVAQVQDSFQVKINNYQLGTRTFFANANPTKTKHTQHTIITSIGGLDNSAQLHPLNSFNSQDGKPGIGKRRLSRVQPKATVGGYSPTDLAGAYDLTPLQNAGIQGNNQTVAVFELDGYQSSDITQYLQNFNLGTPNISNVLVDGFNGSAGQGAVEVELDIEVVAALAPKANQIVYEGPNTTQGVNDTYNKIVTDNQAQITTISWGECETQSGTAELQTLDTIFKQGAAQGISFFAASGDSGSYDCNDSNLAVDSPAGDPFVTGVGGTNLQLSNAVYGSESVWSNAGDTQRSPKGSGGGGGISNTFQLPSWQTGPGVQNQYSTGNREVPDVSADADPATGYAVYCTATAGGCPTTGWITVGGTSAAAPLWAGSMAVINEYLQKQGKARTGFANPVLYSLANSQQPFSPFHDVTSGNNLFYPATANYDLASGLGTPDINNIAQDIAALGGTNPNPTPTPTGTPLPGPTPTNTATPVPGPTGTPSPTPTPTGSLIQNGGFEQGTQPWQESSSGGYELVDQTNPHAGSYSAYLCGSSNCSDLIWQSFTVPTTSHLTLSYWWYGDTTQTTQTCNDVLTVTLLNSQGNVIMQLQRSCNGDTTNSWQQLNVDVTKALTKYAGQKVSLVFKATTTSASLTTAFFVDDVALNA